jgi:hypothetical protein
LLLPVLFAVILGIKKRLRLLRNNFGLGMI